MSDTPSSFAGFTPIDANFLYCPNQFFDVCIPHSSRGTVRLVAFVLRKTLGFIDSETGKPISEDVSFSYNQLIARAGISRGAIRAAIQEALDAHYIELTDTGSYRLRWGEGSPYTTTPSEFQGFFAGEGNRTPIPNAFFDHVVPQEPHAVIKVVATVLRHTIGYQNQFGMRRSTAPLSQSFILRYANFKQLKTVRTAITAAVDRRYIKQCNVDDRGFNEPISYAVKWVGEGGSTKKTAVGTKKTSRHSVQKRPPNSTKESPQNQFKKDPQLKDTESKNTFKQHTVVDDQTGYELLVKEGIHRAAAQKLAASTSLEDIQRQISWIDFRNATDRPAMLRKAVEENWPKPGGADAQEVQKAKESHEKEQRLLEDNEQARIARQQQRRQHRRHELLKLWQDQTVDQQRTYRDRAREQARNGLTRRLIANCPLDNPAMPILEVMASNLVS